MEEYINIRTMEINDYDGVRSLWLTIGGFAIRSIDDSREGVARFLRRNPTTSVVAQTSQGRIVGSILCGHDGRRGSFYHVCVAPEYRNRGIGKSMVLKAVEALEEEHISNITLVAFTKNDIGNAFWQHLGWRMRNDCNYYDFILDKDNTINYVADEPHK